MAVMHQPGRFRISCFFIEEVVSAAALSYGIDPLQISRPLELHDVPHMRSELVVGSVLRY